MRMKGKKVIFSYKDTWGLSVPFNKVICAGLKKFLEVKEHKNDYYGVPVGCLLKHGHITQELYDKDESLSECDKIWVSLIEKMIYAFDDNNEPNISDYKFDHDFVETGEFHNGQPLYTIELVKGTEAENERYDRDMKEWKAKVDEGRELLFKYYDNLWW